MPRSSKLEPEVQALVDQAARIKTAIEGMVKHVGVRQSTGAHVIAHKNGEKSRRYGHITFCCDGIKLAGCPAEAWYCTPEAAADVLIGIVRKNFDDGMPDANARVLIWRTMPEVHSVTSEVGDLFNAYVRLTLVPDDWRVDFPEDEETPMDASHGSGPPLGRGII